VSLSPTADAKAKNYDGVTALELAAQSGNAEIAHELITHGADLNAKDNGGETALIVAKRGAQRHPANVEIARELIAHGADLNAKNNSGETALIVAMRGALSDPANVEIERELIAHGADVNEKSFNETPLRRAKQIQRAETARELQRAGGKD